MRYCLMILCCVVGTAVQAQTNLATGNSLDAYWNLPTIPGQTQAVLKLGTANLPSTSAQNEVITNQQGAFNTAVLTVASGSQNRLETNQTSGLNTVDASLSGSNNSVLLNQTGTGNTISFGLSGVNNRYALTQDGSDRIQMQGLQQNNQRLEVAQGSGANSLTVDNTSLFKDSGIPNLRIEQSGGAAITIQQGKIIGN